MAVCTPEPSAECVRREMRVQVAVLRADRRLGYPYPMLVWEDPYMRLDIDSDERLVRQTRTARSYEDLAALQQSLRAMVERMQIGARGEYSLLQDMRAPRGRNDPEFEKTITLERERISGGFRKLAVLVTSQVGRLQVQRHLQGTGAPAKAFLDEAEALRWLKE